MKHIFGFKSATTTGITTITGTPIILPLAKRISDIPAFSHIPPAHSKGEVKRANTFAANNILAVKQPRSHQVTESQRNIRNPGRLFQQPDFDIHSLVFVSLVATEFGVGTIEAGSHIGITQSGLKPVERLH
ncbi:hypothetical protein D3C75_880020 [compost metagenome]